MRQMELFSQYDQSSLTEYLTNAVNKTISLVITDNSTIMMSYKSDKRGLVLRLHRMFLDAGSDVLEELSQYLKNSRINTPLIRDYVDRNSHKLKKKPLRKTRLVHKGKKYDLLHLFNRINTEYFNDNITSSVTWSTRAPKRSVAKRTLGSFSEDMNLIRISPVLDSSHVPLYFLEFVLYHEMLHADLKDEQDGNKRTVHSREFKRREKQFLHYDRAIAWEKKKWG